MTSAEYIPDGGALAYFSPTSKSDSTSSVCSRLWWCCNTAVTSLRDLLISRWLKSVNEDSHLEDCICVFRYSSSDSQHSSLCHLAGVSHLSCLCLTRLDYGSTALVGLSTRHSDTLEARISVLNAPTRMMKSARRNEQVSPLLLDLHWLRVPQRTEFRLAIFSTAACPAQRLNTLPVICKCRWYWLATSAAISVVIIAVRSEDRTHQSWWSIMSRRCSRIRYLSTLLAFRRAPKTDLLKRPCSEQ